MYIKGIMKKYIFSCLCFIVAINCYAETPANLIDFMNSYKSGHYHPIFKDKKGKLKDDLNSVNALYSQVTDEINSGTTDPRVHWLRQVLNGYILLMNRTYHKDTFSKLYGTNDNHGPETIKLKELEKLDYKKALILNKKAGAEKKLNNDMISKIYINRSLPADILEMASRENMSYMEKTGHFENEHEVYQQFYFDMINSYIRDKDYKNALRIIKEFDNYHAGMYQKLLPTLNIERESWLKQK